MAFKMNGSAFYGKAGAFKHSTEKVLGKEQPVGEHSHDEESEFKDKDGNWQYRTSNEKRKIGKGDVKELLKDLEGDTYERELRANKP
jgi:hypothetical protein